MKTIFITGNDTEIGKTWVTRSLVQKLLAHNHSVQIIKPIETGVATDNVGRDARFTGESSSSVNLTYHTLFSFEAPLAPVCAAKNTHQTVTLAAIVERISKLPTAEFRIIESAGGLAVPVDEDKNDFLDLANQLKVDSIIVVIHNRLGAINQTRLIEHYLKTKTKIQCAFWLNEIYPQNEKIKNSNISTLSTLSYPLWYSQNFSEIAINFDIQLLCVS